MITTPDKEKSCWCTNPAQYRGTVNGVQHHGQISVWLQIQQSEWSFHSAMAWGIWLIALSLQASVRVKERKRRTKSFTFSEITMSWSDVLGEGRLPWKQATSLPSQFYLGVSSIYTGPDVRWSSLQLWDVYPRFQSLKLGCHLSSEEHLELHLPRRSKGSLCSSSFQIRRMGEHWKY